jgi:hypothetical protein
MTWRRRLRRRRVPLPLRRRRAPRGLRPATVRGRFAQRGRFAAYPGGAA